MLNAISVDVEEYFHAANLEPVVGPARWWSQESRVEYATNRVLDLFSDCSVQGTFFVLGHTARRHPDLVRRIAERGHELASHGYGHRLAYSQNERQFFRDVYRTKRLLEDLAGKEVLGYRAPNFSITDKTPWAYDCLARAGYTYDSSRYPVAHPRYYNPHQPRFTDDVRTNFGPLRIYPLATAALEIGGKRWNLPVAGGAYWRLLPKYLLRMGLDSVRKEKRWFVCYFHPWELDAGQPVFKQLGMLTRIRHYGGTASFEQTLKYFLESFRFTSIRAAAAQSTTEA